MSKAHADLAENLEAETCGHVNMSRCSTGASEAKLFRLIFVIHVAGHAISCWAQ